MRIQRINLLSYVVEVLCGTVLGMAEEVGDAFDKLKAGAKAVAKKVKDPDKDLGRV